MELASCIVVLKHREERAILQEIIECCRFKVSPNCSLNCIVVQVAAQIQEAKVEIFLRAYRERFILRCRDNLSPDSSLKEIGGFLVGEYTCDL